MVAPLTGKRDSERQFAIAAALLLPWVMLLVTDWTVTPVGMVDAWIYRALGRDLIHANATMGDYYYAARPFVLVPRYFLSRFMLEGVAHAAYGLLCAHALLFAVLDLLTSIARPGTRLLGVLLFGSCFFLLRSLGWGYVDGSILTWFMIGLAGVARWYRPGGRRWLASLVAGGCFAAMLVTHPMTIPMMLTSLGLIALLQRQTKQAGWWQLLVSLAVGGAGAVLVMGLLCDRLYGRFLFFMPIVEASRVISTASWKNPLYTWLPDANWLVLIFFAWLASAMLLVVAKWRRLELTHFQRFAWLNIVGLMTLMAALELFTSAYWLEYIWFASYFLPSALLAITAMVGERTEQDEGPMAVLGPGVVLVLGAAVAWHSEIPFISPPFSARYFPFRVQEMWSVAVPLIVLQLGIAAAATGAVVLSWKKGIRARVLAAGLAGMVAGGPINQVAPGDALEAAASAAIAHAIVIIQDELDGRRPAYWYDSDDPLARVFVTISSGHLAYFSQLEESYPTGARALRSKPDGAAEFFKAGDSVVILDESLERFPRAQKSFAEIGIALRETRRVPLRIGQRSYWLIFATLEPKMLVLQPVELQTDLKAPVMIGGQRLSDREKGFLSFGPYVHLGLGQHRVIFHLRVEGRSDTDMVGSVDAVDLYGKKPRTFASLPLLSSSAMPNGDLDAAIEFTLKEESVSTEFRVITMGNSRLALRSIEVQRPALPEVSPAAVLAAARSLGGPDFVRSADVRTSGLFAHLTAEAEDGHAGVQAEITTGPGSHDCVELSPGDELTATIGDTTRALAPLFVGNTVRYETVFDSAPAGATVKVALSRKSDRSAPESTVVLPLPDVFTAQPVTTLSRSAGLTVNWKARAQPGSLRVRATGSCIQRVDSEVPPATTTHTFPAFLPSRGNEEATCEVTVSLERTVKGSIDPSWGRSGDFHAARVARLLIINSTP